MTASERRLRALTTNLANVGTTGFKRVASVSRGEVVTGRNAQHAVVKTETQVDWTQGPIERTDVATDFALQGEGFFAVEGPEGEVYTRDGRFHLDEAGTLVTEEGYPVAWSGGRGSIDPVGEPLRVGADGSVTQGPRSVGRLKIVDFADKGTLQEIQRGYFRADPGAAVLPSTAEVHQFALEGANVSSVEELVRLIETQRAFEAGSNVVQLISQTYQRLARAGR